MDEIPYYSGEIIQVYDEEADVEEEQTSISKEDEAILKEGGVIGIIEILGLDIRYPVMEGTTSKVLNAGIGHIEETAGIGESGNCVLCGHNGSRYGTFFTPLNQISIGDEVMINDKKRLVCICRKHKSDTQTWNSLCMGCGGKIIHA